MGTKTSRLDCDPVFKMKLNIMKTKLIALIKFFL